MESSEVAILEITRSVIASPCATSSVFSSSAGFSALLSPEAGFSLFACVFSPVPVEPQPLRMRDAVSASARILDAVFFHNVPPYVR